MAHLGGDGHRDLMSSTSPKSHDPSSAARPARAPLTRERIIAAALELVDEHGLHDLTMRRLGARLGVEAMSLYKHVPNKEAVVEGLRETLLDELAELRRSQHHSDSWQEAVRGVARAFREVCRRHPRALPLFAADADRAYAASWGAYEPVLNTMVADGVAPDEAIAALRIVVRHVLADGMLDVVTVTRTAPMSADEIERLCAERPMVGELVRAFHRGPVEDLFEAGLDALLEGLAARFARAGS
jgi:TetR/AcrR family transcriptional regulator, tetracycline repressor protein